ncbi:hypothetical protein SRHO_G00157170 [Serrasalmus rhombeus]
MKRETRLHETKGSARPLEAVTQMDSPEEHKMVQYSIYPNFMLSAHHMPEEAVNACQTQSILQGKVQSRVVLM